MSIETYRLEVDETETGDGIDVDLYDEDDLIEASTRVSYDDYDIEPDDDRDSPDSIVREVTTDVTTVDLQYERDDAGFRVRVLGDRDELVTERIDDEDWELVEGS